MGAQTFSQIASGKTAKEAFDNAVKEAQYDYGHAGYTGTIAEKDSFIMIPTPADLVGQENVYVDYNDDNDDWDKVNDKWGPAGCYDLGNGRYCFFGWASS
jgi:hypothetical protein